MPHPPPRLTQVCQALPCACQRHIARIHHGPQRLHNFPCQFCFRYVVEIGPAAQQRLLTHLLPQTLHFKQRRIEHRLLRAGAQRPRQTRLRLPDLEIDPNFRASFCLQSHRKISIGLGQPGQQIGRIGHHIVKHGSPKAILGRKAAQTFPGRTQVAPVTRCIRQKHHIIQR